MLKALRIVVATVVLMACWTAPRSWGQLNPALPEIGKNSQTPNDILLAALPPSLPATTANADSNAIAAAAIKSEPAILENTRSQPSVNWKGLSKDSFQFLIVMNGFRIATEPGTRAAIHNPLFSGYLKAVSNMHGWDDGDELYVNYIGHPMQGAVSNFIWTNSDRAFNRDTIGWNSNYLKGKLRGTAYSYALSVLFELGPLSEASLGQIQRYHPATGFVDHVVTPSVGLLWSVGEDAIDDSLIRYIEDHTENKWFRLLARSGLNPARTFANLMSRKYPWYRTNRTGVTAFNSSDYYNPAPKKPLTPPPGVPPFQFNIHFETRTFFGQNAADACVGGGSELGFRIADNWQIVGELTGCKQTGLPANFSGDVMTYAVGPQWTTRLSSRWVTHTRILVGGSKVTQEQLFPELKKELKEKYKHQKVFPPLGMQYTRGFDNNAFAMVTGTGIDYKLNNALLIRSAIDYSHTWNRDINDLSYRNSLRISSGLVLNMGTW
jgi:hypothetical protein